MIAALHRFFEWRPKRVSAAEQEMAQVGRNAATRANLELDKLIAQLRENVEDANRLLRETASSPPVKRVGEGVVEEVARSDRNSRPDR
jgi:hypothetical protein